MYMRSAFIHYVSITAAKVVLFFDIYKFCFAFCVNLLSLLCLLFTLLKFLQETSKRANL